MPHYLPWMSDKLNREESRILVMRTLVAMEKSTEVPPLVEENDHWGCLGHEGASPHQARICAKAACVSLSPAASAAAINVV